MPQNRSVTVGVMGPVGEDTSNEEISSSLVASGHAGAVASRILKGKNKLKTSMVKLTLLLLLYLLMCIWYMSDLRSHFLLAIRGSNSDIQRFGHHAQHCTFSVRCVACGGPHQVNDCPGITLATCSNCGGAHTENYGGCLNMKHAKVKETRKGPGSATTLLPRRRTCCKSLSYSCHASTCPFTLSCSCSSLTGSCSSTEEGSLFGIDSNLFSFGFYYSRIQPLPHR